MAVRFDCLLTWPKSMQGYLSSKQCKNLEAPFGYQLEDSVDFLQEVPNGHYSCVLGRSEISALKPPGKELNLRQVLDLALDQDLLMSQAGTDGLAVELNRKLPPVWPGASPIALKLEPPENPDWFLVTIPSRFHNRLHRFPFEDGFFVCPVPDCPGAPRLLGTMHGIRVAAEASSYIIENTCEAGHHWQCIFCEDAQVTSVSVVRLKRMPDLKQRIG